MADGAFEAPTRTPAHQTGPGPDILTVSVDVGRRALIVANLGLKPQATQATTWASAGLAQALDTWEGPGLVVIAGNLLDLTGEPDAAAATSSAVAAHPRLANALRTFARDDDRRVVCIPGATDAALQAGRSSVLDALGVEVTSAADLHMATAAGPRVVRVDAGVPSAAPVDNLAQRNGSSASGAQPDTPEATTSRRTTFTLSPDPAAEWQDGLERLADPAGTPRFLTSRLLYRRFARFAGWLLVPFAIAIALRLPFVSSALDHLVFGHPAPSRAIQRAQDAPWGARLLFAALVCIGELVILALVLGFVARKAWRTLGGGDLDGPFDEGLSAAGATANDNGRVRGPGPVWTWVCRARERDDTASRDDAPRSGVLRQSRCRGRGGGGAPRPAGPAAGVPGVPATGVGGARDRRRATRPLVAHEVRTSRGDTSGAPGGA